MRTLDIEVEVSTNAGQIDLSQPIEIIRWDLAGPPGLIVAKRISSIVTAAQPAINTNNVDIFQITALATDITSFTTNLTGTPEDGDMLEIQITDDGSARALTWGASFEPSGNQALPTTTVANERLDVLFIWNEISSNWRCLAVS